MSYIHPSCNKKITILKAQEEIVRAIIRSDLVLPKSSSIDTNSTREQHLSCQRSAHRLEHITKVRNRDVRRRCASCYNKLFQEGKSVPYARKKTKKVMSEC